MFLVSVGSRGAKFIFIFVLCQCFHLPEGPQSLAVQQDICLSVPQLSAPEFCDTVLQDQRFAAFSTFQERLLLQVNLRSTLAQAADPQDWLRDISHMICLGASSLRRSSTRAAVLHACHQPFDFGFRRSRGAAPKPSGTDIDRSSAVYHHSSRIVCVTAVVERNIVDGSRESQQVFATLSFALSLHVVHCFLFDRLPRPAIARRVTFSAAFDVFVLGLLLVRFFFIASSFACVSAWSIPSWTESTP